MSSSSTTEDQTNIGAVEPITSPTLTNPKNKKRKRLRCSYSLCKSKLTMIDLGMECKCGLAYCGRHRLPEDHDCSYDHKGEAQSIIAKKIKESACTNDKIIPV